MAENSQTVELLLKHVASLQSDRDRLAQQNAELLEEKKRMRPTNPTSAAASSGSLSDASTTATAAEMEARDMQHRVSALIHAISSTCLLADSPQAHLFDMSPEALGCWALQTIRTATFEAEESALRATLQGATRTVTGSTHVSDARKVFASQLNDATRAINKLHSTYLASTSSFREL